MRPLEQRARYASDGGVAWPRLPVLIAVPFAAAVGLAWLLKFAFVHEWYLIFLLPGAAALALGGVLYGLVGWAHCRNRWLAGAVGLLAGAVAYLGYFEFCLADHLPPGAGLRLDLLPGYIEFRMRTDVAEDVGRPNVGQANKLFSPLNWFTFGCELLMLTGAATALAWSRARRAYCPPLGRWMRQESTLLPPSCGENLLGAIDAGRLVDFLADTPPGGDPQTGCRVALEYAAPSDGSVLDYPVYLTVEDIPDERPWYRPAQLRQPVVRQVELEPPEVLTLRPLFPDLSQLLAAQHPQLRDLPAEVVPSPAAERPAGELAEVTPIPEPYRRRVRGPRYALWVNLHGLTPLVYFLGGGGVLAGGAWLAVEGSLFLGVALAVVGAAAFAWGAYSGLFCLAVPENRWIERRLRTEFAQRSDALVDPADPESMYVSLIPRESFVKVKLTMASDVLLLKLDEKGRRLLLEGDSDRYRIPAGAITACEPQCFFHPIDHQHQNELWMVRLLVRVPEGVRELLLSVGHTRYTPMTNHRRRETAEALCARVNRLRELGQGAATGPGERTFS